MAKIRNQLYSNPENAKPHEKGAKVILVQGVRVGDKKFMLPAICYPYNFYVNMAFEAENEANKLLEEILKFVRKSNQDLPYVEKTLRDNFVKFALSAVVWSYAAIEAKANCVIDSIATEKKKERYLRDDLAIKLKDHLPKLAKKDRLSGGIWNKFHGLDTLRHTIIHTKTTQYWLDADNWDNTLDFQMCNGKFQGVSQTAITIIDHFNLESKNTGTTVFHNVKRGLQSRPN